MILTERIQKTVLLGVVFSFCVTLSTVLFFSDNIYVDDSASYIKPAKSILEAGTFNIDADSNEPMFFRTPGYPLLLSAIYSVGGDSLIILVQWAMFLLSAYVCYRIASEIVNSQKVALLVGAIALFDVGRLYFSQVILTETFFTLLFVVALYVLVLYMKKGLLKHLVFFGLLISGAMLTRPMLQFLLPLLPLLSGWIVYTGTRSLKKAIVHTATLTFIFVIIVGGWAYRNYTYSGVFDVSSNKGDNGYYYKKAVVLADIEGVRFLDKKNELQKKLLSDPEYLELNEMERSRFMVQSTMETLLEHPFRFLKIQAKALVPLFFDPGSANFAVLWGMHQKNSGIVGDFSTLPFADYVVKLIEKHLVLLVTTLAGMIYLIPLYVLTIVGIIQSGKYVKKELPGILWVALAVIFGYMVYFSLGVESFSRLRMPVMGFFYVLAGIGLYHVISTRKNSHV